MRFRLLLLSLIAFVLAAVLSPSSAFAKPRMLVGLQDDPTLRWPPDRAKNFGLAQQAHVGIVRTTVYWSRIAEKKPRNAANPFDKAYRFSDLDEFVRDVGLRGMEVMLTIWGTPKWAIHGGAGTTRRQTRRPAEVRPGRRQPLLRPASRICLRPLLHGLERD